MLSPVKDQTTPAQRAPMTFKQIQTWNSYPAQRDCPFPLTSYPEVPSVNFHARLIIPHSSSRRDGERSRDTKGHRDQKR